MFLLCAAVNCHLIISSQVRIMEVRVIKLHIVLTDQRGRDTCVVIICRPSMTYLLFEKLCEGLQRAMTCRLCCSSKRVKIMYNLNLKKNIHNSVTLFVYQS